MVLAFPDGRWVVVDSCVAQGDCLPLALLRHLDAPQVDLVIVSHPDLDHINGLPALLDAYPPGMLWRYPAATMVRDFLARWCRGCRGDRRLRELFEANERMERLERANRARDGFYGISHWPRPDAGYRVHCIAPTQHDLCRMRSQWRRVIEWSGATPQLAAPFQNYLLGKRSRLPDRPNAVSLAVVVEWGGFKVLLAGDVENGTNAVESGWSGVLQLLEDAEQLTLLRTLDAVKVAHHGSNGAFWPDAWRLHTDGRRVSVAMIAPFNRGAPRNPPHVTALRNLRRRADRLIVTSGRGQGQARARRAEWVDARQATSGSVPCAALVFRQTQPIQVHLGAGAKLYRRR